LTVGTGYPQIEDVRSTLSEMILFPRVGNISGREERIEVALIYG